MKFFIDIAKLDERRAAHDQLMSHLLTDSGLQKFLEEWQRTDIIP
jgi:hypothetical protein